MDKTKRTLITGLAATVTGMLVPGQTLAKILSVSKRRKVALHNIHTDETTEVTYWKDGVYQERAILKLNELLRDHRKEQVANMDINVIDQIYAIQKKLSSDEQVQVISGFRSKSSNEELSQRSRGVAKRSYHTLGRAIDIYIPDVSLKKQRIAAVRLNAGGVGYYRRSKFIHIDSGPVRFW